MHTCVLTCTHGEGGLHTQGWAACLHCGLYQRLQLTETKSLALSYAGAGKTSDRSRSVQFQSHLWSCCTSVPVSDSGEETVFMKCFPRDPFRYTAALYRDESFTEVNPSIHLGL